MANLTISEGLALARAHMERRLAWVRAPLRDPASVDHTLSYRWEFPTGGNVSVTIGYDLGRTPDGAATLVPRARVSASLGTSAAQALDWARDVREIVLATVEAETLMREHAYRADDEPVAHAQSTDVHRDPYPTPACHAKMAPGDHVILPENTGRFRVTCGSPECQRAAMAHVAAASRSVREIDPEPRASASERERRIGRRRS